MEQKCPQCGFLQPKDDFCAHCGVHIGKYRKRKSSLKKRRAVFSSLLAFSFLILCFIYSYFFSSQSPSKKREISNGTVEVQESESKEKQEASFNKVDVKAQIEEKEIELKGKPKISDSVGSKQIEARSMKVKKQNLGEASSIIKKSKPSAGQKKTAKESLEPKKPQASDLRVLFAEIPKEVIGRLFEEEESLSNRALLILKKTSLNDWVQGLQGKILSGGGVQKIIKNQEIRLNFLYGERDRASGRQRDNVNSREALNVRIAVSELENEGASKQEPQFRTLEVNTESDFGNDQAGFYGNFRLSPQKFLLLLGEFLPKDEDLEESNQDRELDSDATTEAGLDTEEEESQFLNLAERPLPFDTQELNREVEIVLILQLELK